MSGPSRLIAANSRDRNALERPTMVFAPLSDARSRYIYFSFVCCVKPPFFCRVFCRYGDPICGPIVDIARYATRLRRKEFNGTLEHLKVAHLPAAVGREKFRARLPSRYSHKIDKRPCHLRGFSLIFRRNDELNTLHGY